MGKRFPIQDGPSVPWSVMAPFEYMSQKNHDQSLERIAQRGGFGAAEAWCIVTGRSLRELTKHTIPTFEMEWRKFAALENAKHERLRSDLAASQKREAKLRRAAEQWELIHGDVVRQRESALKSAFRHRREKLELRKLLREARGLLDDTRAALIFVEAATGLESSIVRSQRWANHTNAVDKALAAGKIEDPALRAMEGTEPEAADESEPTSEALEAWREWYQKEQAAGNVRGLVDIMHARHGCHCECKDCAGEKCEACA